MSRWSFIAQRATTGEFLHFDVPLELGSLEWQLSGPGSLKATISPDVGDLRDSAGRPILEEWATLLYAEADGEIRWGGIIVSCSVEGDTLSLEAAGFSTYLHRRIYNGHLYEINVDPAGVVRHIWQHVQSFPRGDLNVTVKGDSTPVRLGTDAVKEYTPPKLFAAQHIIEQYEAGEGYPVNAGWTWPGQWAHVTEWVDDLVAEYGGNTLDRTASMTWLKAYIESHKDEIVEAKDAEPYELLWYEHPNCGEEVDSLAKSTPFDWVERHSWGPGKESIVHEIEIAYPRFGRLRDDLVFVQEDNATAVFVVDSNGDEFANHIVGLGAGEGQDMLRGEIWENDDRLLVDSVYADKAITDPSRLDAMIADELCARRAGIRITSLDVIDHPNAPLGSWQLGDDVTVRAHVPWLGEISLRVRILGWSLTGEDTATLEVERSDFYRYGGAQ
jgi:hypothetical protein